MCPDEMVPLQIDRAIDLGRYLSRSLANPWGIREPAIQDPASRRPSWQIRLPALVGAVVTRVPSRTLRGG
jgi:hypothetical protein